MIFQFLPEGSGTTLCSSIMEKIGFFQEKANAVPVVENIIVSGVGGLQKQTSLYLWHLVYQGSFQKCHMRLHLAACTISMHQLVSVSLSECI